MRRLKAYTAWLLRTVPVLLLSAGTGLAYYEGLKMGTRAEGMGEAFVGLADDVNALYYNPAGLGLLQRFQIPSCYYKPMSGLDLGGFNHMYFAAAGPVPKYGHLGTFGLAWFRSSSSFIANLDDGQQEYDMNAENILFLSWGRKTDLDFTVPKLNRRIKTQNLYLGGNFKLYMHGWNNRLAMVNSENDWWDGDYSGAGIGLDFAGLYFPEQFPELSLGWALTDFIKTSIGIHEPDYVESKLKGGLAYFIKSVNVKELSFGRFTMPAFAITDIQLAADAVVSTRKLGFSHLHLGWEKWLDLPNNQEFAVRNGFKLGAFNYTFFALGASYRYFLPKAYGGLPFKYGFQFDYAFTVPMSGIRSTYGDHGFTITLLQGGKADEMPPNMGVVARPSVFSPDNDGTDDRITFTVRINDENPVTGWRLSILAPRKAAPGDSVKYDTLQAFNGSGIPERPLVWDGRRSGSGDPVVNGDYLYQLTAVDKYGNAGATDPQKLTVRVAPLEYDIIPRLESFSPNGDGRDDEALLDVKLDRRMTITSWMFRVATENGREVYVRRGKGMPPENFTWSGRAENRKISVDGTYLVSLDMDGAKGETYRIPGRPVLLDRTGPAAALTIVPAAGDSSVVFTLVPENPADVAAWQLIIIPAADNPVDSVITTIPGQAGVLNATWNLQDNAGNRMPEAVYRARAECTDALGNRKETAVFDFGIGGVVPPASKK